MKTPISYYGGKQNLIPDLLPLIPPHQQYGEPFCGGASLFWAKRPSQNEFINDYNLMVSNFWQQLQANFEPLQELVQNTLHHEGDHTRAKSILKAPMEDPVLYAWAFWVQTQMSFSFRLFGGFRFSNGRGEGRSRATAKERLKKEYYERLKNVTIFCRDAIELIQLKDDPDTFMYFDPPYAESNCGHYESGKNVYYDLLALLPSLKCKWLMSSYPSDELTALRLKMGYNSKDIQQALSVSGKNNEGKLKTECLTYNYSMAGQQQPLFT